MRGAYAILDARAPCDRHPGGPSPHLWPQDSRHGCPTCPLGIVVADFAVPGERAYQWWLNEAAAWHAQTALRHQVG